MGRLRAWVPLLLLLASGCLSFDSKGEGPGGPSSCGDGVVDEDEICDDGNNEGSDSCSADCAAASCLVPVTHETVGEILADLECPVVSIASGSYQERIEVEGPRTIRGVGATRAILDGGGLGAVVTALAGSITIEHIEITNGSGADGGGVVNTAELTLRDVAVHHNRADVTGAGILHDDGTLDLFATEVSENTISGALGEEFLTSVAAGAGIFAKAPLTIRDGSRVVDNVAELFADASAGHDPFVAGGGVVIDKSTLLVNGGSEVSRNEVGLSQAGSLRISRASGAGIVATEAQLNLSNCTVSENRVIVSGGPYVEARGGGIAVRDTVVRIDDSAVVSANLIDATSGIVIAEGGGLYGDSDADIIATDAEFSANSITARNTSGGGLANGGGIATAGLSRLSLLRVELSGNRVEVTGTAPPSIASGGGVFVHAPAASSATTSALSITASTLASNSAMGPASFGGAVAIAANEQAASASLSGSTLDANSAQTGGGLSAIADNSGTITLTATNATISGNSATDGAGIALTATAGSLFVNLGNSTVATNAASGSGGGVLLNSPANSSLFTFRNTIVASNTAPNEPDCSTSADVAIDGGFNLYGVAAGCQLGADDGSLLSVDPVLAALADNGGLTPTHAIDSTSPAFNGGDPEGCSASGTRDQRGEARNAHGRCDIGAFEVQ